MSTLAFVFGKGLIGDRPAAAVEGRFYFATDTSEWSRDNGSTWDTLSSPGAPGADGADGADGVGVPVGGTAGQALTKIDGTNFNTQWTTIVSSPGGADTQVQFNDGSAFGGDAGLTFNKTTKALDVGGATVTANDPVLGLTQTWNNAAVTFNGINLNVTNTASAAASLLMNLQVAGTSKFIVRADAALGIYTGGLGDVSGNRCMVVNNTGLAIVSGGAFGWASGYGGTTGAGGAPDLTLARDASDILAQRRSTNAQTFRVYNTYTNASNYECGKISWNSNVLEIGTEKLGTGTARALALQTDGTTRATVGAAGGIAMAAANTFTTGAYTVATLPAAGTVGRIAHVTDGDASLAWGATVVNSGAGATKYLCFDNGTNWTVAGK